MASNKRTPSIPDYSRISKESRHRELLKQYQEPPNSDDKVREFLAKWTIILIILDLGTYIVTRDISVLLGGSIIAITARLVFQYYFKRQR